MTRHLVVRTIERPDPHTVAGLAQAGVATVHEALGRRGLVGTSIQPIQQGMTIAGPAITVSAQAGDNLMIHAAVEMCSAGDILVVTTTSPSTDGMFGELLATSLRARGVAGLVIDAGVRDVSELRAMRFPVWARAVSAQGTVKASAGSVNVPVVCGGQRISPGDVIVADDDGVVCVPASTAVNTLQKAGSRLDDERARRVQLASGTLSLDIYDLRPLLARLGVEYVDQVPRDES